MKVIEAIRKGTAYLAKHDIESARLQCEWLLSEILVVPRLQLYLNFEKELSESETGCLRDWLRKRVQGIPIQHLTGKVNFCGLEIRSDARALVPRPETEFLAEWVWETTREMKRKCGRPAALLDVGTGAGCIALAVAFHDPDALITASDLSRDALELAVENGRLLGLSGRIEFRQADLFDSFEGHRFDFLVSNPPYIPSLDIPNLPIEVRCHDPRSALDGGLDGLDFYRRFAMESAALLRPGGTLFLELGDGQAEQVREVFVSRGWIGFEVRKDLSGRERYVGFSRPD